MQTVLINYKLSSNNLSQLVDSDLFFIQTEREFEIIVDDNGIEDDKEFVTSYGLNYDQVNSIELI